MTEEIKSRREKYAEEITNKYMYIYTVTENMICFAFWYAIP